MRGKRLAASVVALGVVAAACGGDDSDGSTSEPTTSDEVTTSDATDGDQPTGTADDSSVPGSGPTDEAAELDPDATLDIIITAPPPASWDPANTANTTQDVAYFSYVYDTLLFLDGDNQVNPRLATAWNYDDTNTVLTLTLRDDVTFTDGAAFDAEVAKLNLDRVREGTGAGSRLLADIVSIDVTSPTELVITQSSPTSKVLVALTSTAASMASPDAIADPQGLAQTPVGSGPFVLDAHDTSSATFVRRDDRWDTDVEYVAQAKLTGTPDGNARLNALLSGSVDLAQLSQTPPTPDALAKVDSGELQMVTTSGQPTLIGINNSFEPLDNPLVVEAINHAIDRDAFNQIIYNGACEPSSQVFVDGQVGHIEGLEYTYDPDLARELLAEAGVGEFTITMQTVAGAPTIAIELLQNNLSQVGITVELQASPIAEVFSNFFGGEFPMSNLQLSIGVPDPSFVTDYLTGTLNPGTKDPELVELVDTANALPADDPDREAAYAAVNQYVFDNAVVVPLCRLPNTMLAAPELVGVDDIPFAGIGGTNLTRLGVRAG